MIVNVPAVERMFIYVSKCQCVFCSWSGCYGLHESCVQVSWPFLSRFK